MARRVQHPAQTLHSILSTCFGRVTFLLLSRIGYTQQLCSFRVLTTARLRRTSRGGRPLLLRSLHAGSVVLTCPVRVASPVTHHRQQEVPLLPLSAASRLSGFLQGFKCRVKVSESIVGRARDAAK